MVKQSRTKYPYSEAKRRHCKDSSIWDTPRLKKMLSQPLSTPIKLTKKEADKIVAYMAGKLPHFPRSKKS